MRVRNMVDVAHLDKAFLRLQFRLLRNQQLNFLDVLLRLVTDGVQPSRVCEHVREIGSPTDRVSGRFSAARAGRGPNDWRCNGASFPARHRRRR